MAVSAEVRKVEEEIDNRVRAMPLWRCAREPVVRAALDYYRGAGEVLMLMIAWATASFVPVSSLARQNMTHHCQKFLPNTSLLAREARRNKKIPLVFRMGTKYVAALRSRCAQRHPGSRPVPELVRPIEEETEMTAIALVLLLLFAVPAAVEGVPIDLSASLGGLSVDGSTEDALGPPVAGDCAPGATCLPPKIPVTREIELKLPKEPGTPPAEKAKVIVVPNLPPELKESVEAIKQQHSAKESVLLFEFLKEELLKGNLDDFLKEFEKVHLEIGVKKGSAGELTDYDSLLEELLGDGFLYKGSAKFAAGFIPLGAALIVFNPETGEGAAAVTLFAVPHAATLVLVSLGLLALPRRRRTGAR